jgi:hypothetical protein
MSANLPKLCLHRHKLCPLVLYIPYQIGHLEHQHTYQGTPQLSALHMHSQLLIQLVVKTSWRSHVDPTQVIQLPFHKSPRKDSSHRDYLLLVLSYILHLWDEDHHCQKDPEVMLIPALPVMHQRALNAHPFAHTSAQQPHIRTLA